MNINNLQKLFELLLNNENPLIEENKDMALKVTHWLGWLTTENMQTLSHRIKWPKLIKRNEDEGNQVVVFAIPEPNGKIPDLTPEIEEFIQRRLKEIKGER